MVNLLLVYRVGEPSVMHEAKLVAAVEERLDEQVDVHVDIANHDVEGERYQELVALVILPTITGAVFRQDYASPDACC